MNQEVCHWTAFPNVTCIDALRQNVGFVNTTITWKRIKWNNELAEKYKYGEQTSETADLSGVVENTLDSVNIGFKFFDETSCALGEGGSSGRKGCILQPGWRQLLRFESSSKNVGKTDLHLGDVFSNQYLEHAIFEFDPCHLHYHFQHYENYLFGNLTGRKTGFCLQTTWRYHNNEYVGFNTPYSFCSYQGISVGWGSYYFMLIFYSY